MKFLVVGGGSMGKRRIRCLLANNVKPQDIRLVEIRSDRQAEVKSKHDVESFGDLTSGLRWDPNAVIISVPGSAHMEASLAAARACKPLFIEVPLSTNLDGVDELVQLVERHRILVAPGTQPPFHPLFKQFKQWLDDPTFGKPLTLLADFGQWLPDWHPYEDYRTFYAASQEMGGGNLDVIAQEMALFCWLLGESATRVFCQGSKLSSLEIKANDCWDIIATMSSGTSITLHADMIQRAGRNGIRVVSEAGTIEIDVVAGQVRRFLATSRTWESQSVPQGYVYEQCYIDEIRLFIDCIRGQAQWHNPLPVAIDIVRFLLAMQRSSMSGKVESVH